MSTHVLMPDTQAILLLCASFGQNRQTEPQPLTLSEYNNLASWLKENKLRPADLLTPIGKDQLPEITGIKLNPNRLIALLERGVMLGLAVESWISQGLWILGRSDAEYPKRLKKHLRHLAPAILYGIGNIELLSIGGLAVVGSRDVDEEGINYTHRVAQTCAQQGIQIVSGGARGVDQVAMLGALEAAGTALGMLADSLTKAAVASMYRSAIREGRLTLVSAYDPDVGFNVGNAMGRNKYIYALADYALVVSSSFAKGGTWAGAVEALEKQKDLPVFVRLEGTIPEGNQQLINKGAKSFPKQPWNDSLRTLLDSAIKANKTEIELTTTNITVSPIDETKSIRALQNDVEAIAINDLPSEPATTALGEVNQYCPQDIYEAVIPFILKSLEQPKSAKSLAECLDVRPGQIQDWLKRAVAEGKVLKTKTGYLVNQEGFQLSLLP
ncbi:DNA-processing protein DprA [Coleofasciculus sp. H7-2]|uniref:DNA-processing protein DprA n=1 Tax=Coleofasciculus sp. H7-2 TaxID=3351545 RepID=UPI003670F3F7